MISYVNPDRQRSFSGTWPRQFGHNYLAHRLTSPLRVLTGRHRSGDGVSLVLVGAYRHAFEAKLCQSLPAPG